MLKHSKKRNVGLINEFFVRSIAQSIIEQKDSNLLKAKTIYKKHFNKGTSLNEELKLFNALYNTKVSNKESAHSLMTKVKEICKLQSQSKIDLEKTALLHEINQNLSGSSFFEQNISDYKIYATIQVLLNHWRNGLLNEDLTEISQLEDKLVEHLTTQKVANKDVGNVLDMTNKDIDKLVLKMMFEKLNAKFGESLTDEQKNLVNVYVFAAEKDEARNKLDELLVNIKSRNSSLIKEELIKNPSDSYTNEKLQSVYSMLEGQNSTNCTDKDIVFYLSILKLERELKNVSS